MQEALGTNGDGAQLCSAPCLTASQCVGPGLAANLATVVTATAMSGCVANVAQLRAPMAGMSRMATNSAVLCGACSDVSQIYMSMPGVHCSQHLLSQLFVVPHSWLLSSLAPPIPPMSSGS
jgi:hypothetical protein